MKDLLLYIARNLVDHPEAVTVTEVPGQEEITLELRVAPEDMAPRPGRAPGSSGPPPSRSQPWGRRMSERLSMILAATSGLFIV